MGHANSSTIAAAPYPGRRSAEALRARANGTDAMLRGGSRLATAMNRALQPGVRVRVGAVAAQRGHLRHSRLSGAPPHRAAPQRHRPERRTGLTRPHGSPSAQRCTETGSPNFSQALVWASEASRSKASQGHRRQQFKKCVWKPGGAWREHPESQSSACFGTSELASPSARGPGTAPGRGRSPGTPWRTG